MECSWNFTGICISLYSFVPININSGSNLKLCLQFSSLESSEIVLLTSDSSDKVLPVTNPILCTAPHLFSCNSKGAAG